MAIELKKPSPVELRTLGLNEKWLQDQITDDTSILGLGELEIFKREHRQQSGGRIDFLMHHAETNFFYEVEVMLGSLDESHIIRCIEYWDIERQRRPRSEHRAVIVAEHITSRFFNVLRLLNRSVPLIAVQLNAFKLDDSSIILSAVTVLDVVAEEDEPETPNQAEQTDRAYWEGRRDPSSLSVMDKIVAALKSDGVEPRLSYNKHHIAFGSTGTNFCWFHPRKTAGYCHIELRLNSEMRDDALAQLQRDGVDAYARSTDSITFSITAKELDAHLSAIVGVLKVAESLSK